MGRTGAVAVLSWAAIAFATRALAQGVVSSVILPQWALQHTYQMDLYTELADRGAGRGEELYVNKCFVCHNQYAKGGPALEGLFRRSRLTNGRLVDDRTVAAAIRIGAPGMPGYRFDMSGEAVAALLDYLHSSECCYEAENPPANPRYLAATHRWLVPSALRGGVHGVVRGPGGNALAGVRVQLIEPNGVRITVFTDGDGTYEFPAMKAGTYLLRVATPLFYEPYQRGGVRVAGQERLSDIVLRKVPQAAAAESSLPGALPVTEEIAAQLSGSELLWNLSGTMQEKTAFIRTCGIGCHDLKETLRNRFDEHGWRLIAEWMTSSVSGSSFVVRRKEHVLSPDAEEVVAWLSRVRGPKSKDDPYRAFPPPADFSSRVVLTEYELPRKFLSIHQVTGDSRGDIWYTSHRTPLVGMLDPRSGIVHEYRVADDPGTMPGTHSVAIDRRGIVWLSQSWGDRLIRLDPATGEITQESIKAFDGGWSGNLSLDPDGNVWIATNSGAALKIDPRSGKVLRSSPFTAAATPADSMVSQDGKFWAGGAGTMGEDTGMMLDIGSGKMYDTSSGSFPSSAARGGFDRHDNAWFGGHTGTIVEIVNQITEEKGVHMRAFTPPLPYFPYSQFYSAMPDRNGEIWSAWLYGPAFVRFSPATHAWRVYDMAEPSAFARSTWVDNSTNPVTIWYADYQLGVLVRIQPRE